MGQASSNLVCNEYKARTKQKQKLYANLVSPDVQLTKDDQPVIYHDFVVSGCGVHTLTYSQVGVPLLSHFEVRMAHNLPSSWLSAQPFPA
jgi:glycerophosphoryl diester phosphodiesterase